MQRKLAARRSKRAKLAEEQQSLKQRQKQELEEAVEAASVPQKDERLEAAI